MSKPRCSCGQGFAGEVRAIVVSAGCFLRGLPLFFRASPRTPLRALCLIALDTVQVLRNHEPLQPRIRERLAAFVDFQACANAQWDGKDLCLAEYTELQQRLENTGLRGWAADYSGQLRKLETGRPSIAGAHECFEAVRAYREAVVRLDLGALAGLALDAKSIEEGIHMTRHDADLAALWQMSMQCQIFDDVLDYREDLSAALPSFLTAVASLPLALALTANMARHYGASSEGFSGRAAFPLRVALHFLTGVTTALIGSCSRRFSAAASALETDQRSRDHMQSNSQTRLGSSGTRCEGGRVCLPDSSSRQRTSS